MEEGEELNNLQQAWKEEEEEEEFKFSDRRRGGRGEDGKEDVVIREN